MNIINLTPHSIVIFLESGTRTIPASGTVARAKTIREQIDCIDGIPVFRTSFGEVEGLPEPAEGTMYIVSSLAAQGAKHRNDLYVTDDPVRDEENRIIGCRSLGKI